MVQSCEKAKQQIEGYFRMGANVKNLFSFLLGKHNARNATIITTGLSLFSRLFGYFRTLLVAYLFGATAFVDAYYVASGAVTFIFNTLNATIEAAILPSMIQNDEKTAKNIFGFFFQMLTVLTAIIAILMLLFPTHYIKIFARTFDSERIAYASDMVKWILPFGIATLAVGLFSAWANYKNRFAAASTVLAFANILAIVALLALYPLIGETALPAFLSVGYVILAVVLWHVLREAPLRPQERLEPVLIRKISGDMMFRILASGSIFLYVLIDRYFASSLPPGNVSAISYANLLFQQPTGLTAAAFTIYFVRASEKATSPEESKGLLFTTLFMAGSYFLPATALLSILAYPIIVVLLGHGAFDTQAVQLTYPCLAILALGLPIFIWNLIVNKHAIAMGKLKILVVWGYAGVIGNFILDWLFVEPFGAPGLCAATAIMWYISTICLMLFFCKDILWPLFKALAPQFLIICVWAFPLWFVTSGRIWMALIIGSVIGALHYLCCDRFGVYTKMPEQWRPLQILSCILNKIKPPLSH